MLTPARSRSLAVALMLIALTACAREPSDDQLLRWFTDHRSDLERLVRMSDEDFAARRVIRIAPDFTRLVDNWGWPRPESEWGISRERWDEYRRMFRRVGLSSGFNRDGEHHGHIERLYLRAVFLDEKGVITSEAKEAVESVPAGYSKGPVFIPGSVGYRDDMPFLSMVGSDGEKNKWKFDLFSGESYSGPWTKIRSGTVSVPEQLERLFKQP